MTSIVVPVPSDYELAKLKPTPADQSYWMKPTDSAAVERTGDLPSENGYMHGELSLSVAYDREQNLFVGADDPEALAARKAAFPDLSEARYFANEHPALLLSLTDPRSGNRMYAAYISTGIDTNVVFISYRPAGNSGEVGDFVWDTFRKSLKPGNP